MQATATIEAYRDERLCEEVMKYPHFYNSSMKEYKCIYVDYNSWREIAQNWACVERLCTSTSQMKFTLQGCVHTLLNKSPWALMCLNNWFVQCIGIWQNLKHLIFWEQVKKKKRKETKYSELRFMLQCSRRFFIPASDAVSRNEPRHVQEPFLFWSWVSYRFFIPAVIISGHVGCWSVAKLNNEFYSWSKWLEPEKLL